MGKSGFVVAEQGHFVQLIAPISTNTALTSEVFSLENWSHASIGVYCGAGSSFTITVDECDNFTPDSAATMTFAYTQETTAAGDTLGAALTDATTAGCSTGAGSGVFTLLEIDADEMTDGMPCLRIHTSGCTASLMAAFAVLSGGRFQEDITATVIA